MRTAVDSSVLLDVIVDDEELADASERALREAAAMGSLVLGECVLAEIRPAFTGSDIDEFLSDWQLEFVATSRASALIAGETFGRYLTRRRSKGQVRVVADFLIGAHALAHADRLLARDRGYYRDYFEGLLIVEP